MFTWGAIMMDSKARPRRLRKVAEILKELQSLSSSDSHPSSESCKSDSSNSISSSNSTSSKDSKKILLSSDSEKPSKKKQKEKKAKIPKLKTFNKLLNFNTLNEDYSVEEFEFLRDQPLEFDSFKPNKKALDQKAFKDELNKASYSLAKSVLTNKDEKDSFVVNNPVKVTGFISKNLSQNSREVFREGLKNQINSRKTNHIDNEGIFNKPSTDFEKRDEKPVIIINDLSLNSLQSNKSAKSSEKSDEVRKSDFSIVTPAGSTRNSSPVFTRQDRESNSSKTSWIPSDIAENSESRQKTEKISKKEKNEKKETKETKKKKEKKEKNENNEKKEKKEKQEINEKKEKKGEKEKNKESSILKTSQKKKNLFIDLEAEKSGDDHSSDTLEENYEDFIPEMIDDSDLPRDENYSKHLKDLLEKEEKDLQKVVNAEFKRKKSEKIELASRAIKKTQSKPEAPKSKVFSRSEEDFDEDSKLLALNQFRGIKHFRLQEQKAPIFDEKSNDYLKLFERPETFRASRSLLTKPFINEKTIKKPSKAFFIFKK
jgi:hypothetical protein